MTEKCAETCLHSCLAADESRHSDFLRTRFPSTSASSPGAASNVAQTQQRDKRRFYVKKAVIDIGRFKEWEEKLGDSWYRHHNKVNNIVYYHCKHEPCYASMKAKVMVDFVQLYVTEEGHTHPPFGNTVITTNDAVVPPAEFLSNPVTVQTNGIVARRFPRPNDEQQQLHTGWTSPLIYQHHLITELMRIHKDANETPPKVANSQVDDAAAVVTTSGNESKQSETFQNASVIVSDPTVDGQKQETSTVLPSANDGSGEDGSVTTEDVKDVDQPFSFREPRSVVCENGGPSGSPESFSDGRTTSASVSFSAEPLPKRALINDSEDDDESSVSDESNEVYSPINIDVTPKVESPSQSNGVTTNDIFSLLKAKVESQPPRRRLKSLRRMKRRLSYLVEMEELRCLAAKLPPSMKCDDLFQSRG